MTELLSLHNVTVNRQGRRKILDIPEFSVDRGELVAVVGPNGAGKTTLLQMINLLHPFEGEMRLFGTAANAANAGAMRRRSALVFQESLLLDGSVFGNVAWPLRFRGVPAAEAEARVHRALADFGCDHLARRPARQLSGGEAQRVCIARALVTEPELLLLDEPFASLDAPMRGAMMEEIRKVAERLGITVLLVSHNFSDVLSFAERAVALFEGRILQDDRPETLMRRPRDERVARLVGMDNILPCRLEEAGGDRFIALGAGIRFLYGGPPADLPTVCCLPGDALSIYAENGDDPPDGRVVLEGRVERVTPGIGVCRVLVRTGELALSVRLPRDAAAGRLENGGRIRLCFHPREAQLL